MDIAQLDKNFTVQQSDENGIVWYDVTKPPFTVCGLLLPDEEYDGFHRMPQCVAETVSNGVHMLSRNTSGGRVRFVTNASEVHIKIKLNTCAKMATFALTGTAGMDLYETVEGRERYINTFIPPFDVTDGYSAVVTLAGDGNHAITMHFPLYSSVAQLFIGLKEGATLSEHTPYRHKKRIVYYGSSITQGGCASRPGNSYTNILSRAFDCDHQNLGFSGNARGEQEMAQYIAGLSDMAAFVLDYDHNANSDDLLRRTHKPLFEAVRAAHPDLPIVIVSRPNVWLKDWEIRWKGIIKETYDTAVAAGDTRVAFIDGSEIMHRFGGDSGTVDNCHPNDLGFMCMATVIGEALAGLLGWELNLSSCNGLL